jgi:two-component system sensor histidine kinase KdpD
LKKATRNHRLKITVQEGLPLLFCDFYLIEMVLINLMTNAMDNSPEGSTIELEAKASDGFIVLSVADEGRGIPEDQLDAIFEKFYRLPESTSPGLGVGLAISKTIAEIHQGFLKAENRPQGGAKFSLFLPKSS